MKVLYILNDVSHYRRQFLEALGKRVCLHVVSFTSAEEVEGKHYRYLSLKSHNFLGFAGSFKEFSLVDKINPDVVLVGYNLHNVFRMLNLFRKNIPIIPVGLFYSENEDLLKRNIRKFLLRNSEIVLTYSDLVSNKLKKEAKRSMIISFNNTHISKSEISLTYDFEFLPRKLKVIWVGTYKRRKKIEKLIEIASKFSFIEVKIIGPGIKENIKCDLSNVTLLGRCTGTDLDRHFSWSDIVINPGSVGLLVMTAAKYNRPIIIDKHNYHGPEIQLAIDARQAILDINDDRALHDKLDLFLNNRQLLIEKGMDLRKELERNYLIENMVEKYVHAINSSLN